MSPDSDNMTPKMHKSLSGILEEGQWLEVMDMAPEWLSEIAKQDEQKRNELYEWLQKVIVSSGGSIS